MSKPVLGVASLICGVVLPVSIGICWTASHHPKHMRSAYRAFHDNPSEETRAALREARARKRESDLLCIVSGMTVSAGFGVTLWRRARRAGGLAAAVRAEVVASSLR